MQEHSSCPCCSGKDFVACCKGIIDGSKIAQTPLELMRSRYTAHICKDMPHIIRTMRGKALKLFDQDKTRQEWFDQCEWTKLEIIDAPEITKHAKDGIVEFKAYYNFEDCEHILHERSKFMKLDNQWYYTASQKKNPAIESSNKVGRNDDCICGSGKKYKKCCGAS